jgi:hypothetical protein
MESHVSLTGPREDHWSITGVVMINIQSHAVVNTFASFDAAASYVSGCPAVIAACVEGRVVTAYGHIWRKVVNSVPIERNFPVVQINPKTQRVMEVFSSVEAAAQRHKLNPAFIVKCLSGCSELAYGSIWRKATSIEVDAQDSQELARIMAGCGELGMDAGEQVAIDALMEISGCSVASPSKGRASITPRS